MMFTSQDLEKIKLDSTLHDNAECKGIALIVSNNYKGTNFSLPSSDEDSDTMKRFFSTLKNYVIVTLQNLKRDEFLGVCKHFSDLTYPQTYKRIVIYFAGHGGDGYISMQDKRVSIEEIQVIFDPTKHPSLANIARIFFIDACRGSKDTHSSTYQAQSKHNEFIAYSTLKGKVAHDSQDGYGGSWTQALCLCLATQENIHKDLGQVLTHVNAKLGQYQTSTLTTSLSESIFFWKESGILTKRETDTKSLVISKEEFEKSYSDVGNAFIALQTKMSVLLKSADFVSLRRACLAQVSNPHGAQLSPNLTEKINKTQKFDDLFDLLIVSPYWSWIDIRILEAMVVASDDPHAVQLLDNYKDVVFSKKLIDLLPNVPSKKVKEEYYAKVVSKVEKDPDTMTVGDLLKFKDQLEVVILDIQKGFCKLEHLETGCIELHWYIPTSCVDGAYQSARVNCDQFNDLHLQYLRIGHYPVIHDPLASVPAPPPPVNVGILGSDITEVTVEDIGDNQEANETAVSETATAQPSSEKLQWEEQKDGGNENTANLEQHIDDSEEANEAATAQPSSVNSQLEDEKDGSSGSDNEGSLEQCTGLDEGRIVAGVALPIQQLSSLGAHRGSTEDSQFDDCEMITDRPIYQCLTVTASAHVNVTPTEVAQPVGPTYIIYSKEHSNAALKLLDFLQTRCGIICKIDQYYNNENIQQWGVWNENSIKAIVNSNGYVLLICSSIMFQQLSEEGSLSIQMDPGHINTLTLKTLIRDQSITDCIIPVCVEGLDQEIVPIGLRGRTIYNLSCSSTLKKVESDTDVEAILTMPWSVSLQRLVCRLKVEPEVITPPLDLQLGEQKHSDSGDSSLGQHKETDNAVRYVQCVTHCNQRMDSLVVRDTLTTQAKFIPEGLLGSGYFGDMFILREGQFRCVGKKLFYKIHNKKEFINECRALSQLNHKNIAAIMWVFFLQDSFPVIVSEWVKNNLAELLSTRQDIADDRKLSILQNISDGILYLHNQCNPPIVHHNLHSNNILLTENLGAKIGDFMPKQAFSQRVTPTCGFSPKYSIDHTSPASNVFSFGVVMLHADTQECPVPRGMEDNEVQRYKCYLDRMKILSLKPLVVSCLNGYPKNCPVILHICKQIEVIMTENRVKVAENLAQEVTETPTEPEEVQKIPPVEEKGYFKEENVPKKCDNLDESRSNPTKTDLDLSATKEEEFETTTSAIQESDTSATKDLAENYDDSAIVKDMSSTENENPNNMDNHGGYNEPKENKVFIVYQQSNEDNLGDNIKSFANFLRNASIECEISDYYQNENINDWNTWITDQVKISDYVLLVYTTQLNGLLCSPKNEKIEMQAGFIMSNDLKPYLRQKVEKPFFIPIILKKNAKILPSLSMRQSYIIPLAELAITVKELTKDTNELTVDIIHTVLCKFEDLKQLVAKLSDQNLTPKQPMPKIHPISLTNK